MNGQIRGIKEPVGLFSCTYAEAIVKCKPFYDNGRNAEVRICIAATLFLTFERESIKAVEADLKRGTV